jgi:hypothetical protein
MGACKRVHTARMFGSMVVASYARPAPASAPARPEVLGLFDRAEAEVPERTPSRATADVDRPSACRSCQGSGLLAPSPFEGERTPWAAELARAEAAVAGGEYPRKGSAVLSGFLRPIACPDCVGNGEAKP